VPESASGDAAPTTRLVKRPARPLLPGWRCAGPAAHTLVALSCRVGCSLLQRAMMQRVSVPSLPQRRTCAAAEARLSGALVLRDAALKLCGATWQGATRMEWDFAHCSLTSERRPLLEIRGAAHARIFRCSLAGLNIQGEVNRATDAILLRALPAASARDAAGALGQGLDELPAGDELPGGVPRVDVNCSVVQHCECALRVLPLTAGPSQHRRPVQVEAHLVNSVLEDNKLALALTCRSLVTPFPSAPLSLPSSATAAMWLHVLPRASLARASLASLATCLALLAPCSSRDQALVTKTGSGDIE